MKQVQWTQIDIINLMRASGTGGYVQESGATTSWDRLVFCGLASASPHECGLSYVVTNAGLAMIHEVLCMDLPRRVNKGVVWVTRDGDEFPAD